MALAGRPGRRACVRGRCLSPPEAFEKVARGDPTWRVRAKIFALQKGNDEGGRPSLWVNAAEGDQYRLIESDGEGFFVPPYVGSRGWVGIYLDTRRVDWWEVTGLVAESYRLVAPRRPAGQGLALTRPGGAAIQAPNSQGRRR